MTFLIYLFCVTSIHSKQRIKTSCQLFSHSLFLSLFFFHASYSNVKTRITFLWEFMILVLGNV